MTAPKSTHIVWHEGHLSAADRVRHLGQQGLVLWFTGLSGSGKSTVAREVERVLVENGRWATVLDGDNIRHGLNRDLGFSPADRTENIRRIGEVAKLFAEANVIVGTAFISPYRADRDAARAVVGSERFVEIFCAADVAACEARDPKGLYKKARAGEIPEFTGISAPYEEPGAPELVLQTGAETLAQSVQKVLDYLRARGAWN